MTRKHNTSEIPRTSLDTELGVTIVVYASRLEHLAVELDIPADVLRRHLRREVARHRVLHRPLIVDRHSPALGERIAA